MITREQIEEVQAESRKRGISIKQTLQEKGISAHQYFRWKRRYAQEAVPAGFLPIADGGLPGGNLPAFYEFADAHDRMRKPVPRIIICGTPPSPTRSGIRSGLLRRLKSASCRQTPCRVKSLLYVGCAAGLIRVGVETAPCVRSSGQYLEYIATCPRKAMYGEQMNNHELELRLRK